MRGFAEAMGLQGNETILDLGGGLGRAFAFVVDGIADHVSGDVEEEGFGLALRSAELSAKSWIDPTAWAYMVAVAEEEGISVEEAAIHYKGLGDTHTIRAGRFFADFGKQMQAHVHDLRTVDRPLPFRDLHATILHLLGLEYEKLFYETSGRLERLTGVQNQAHLITEVLA